MAAGFLQKGSLTLTRPQVSRQRRLRSHPRTSGGNRNPGGLCKQHNLGRFLPPGRPNTNPSRYPPHSLQANLDAVLCELTR
jgi:hypothetical protein